MSVFNHSTSNFIFLNINRFYRPAMSDDELYQATRQTWRVAAWRRTKVQYAVAVYDGVIRAVYEIARWQPCMIPELSGRWEFDRTSRSKEEFSRYIGQPSAPYMPSGARYTVQYNFTN